MPQEPTSPALLRWSADTFAAMNRALGLIAAAPLPDDYDDPDTYAEDARVWCDDAVDAIAEARRFMSSLPPGDHDPGVMKNLSIVCDGNARMLDYGGALNRLILRAIEADTDETEAEFDKVMDLALDYPVLLIDSRARQLTATANAMPASDAVGRLIAVSGIAYAIVTDYQRASVAAERRRAIDFAAMAERTASQLAEYDDALVVAERQLRLLEASLPEQPEADRPLLARIIPTYFEDLAEYRNLRTAFATLPSIAASARTSAGYVAKAEVVWQAFRAVEDANEARTAQRADMVRNHQAP